MCPVRSVTHVSGRSAFNFKRIAFECSPIAEPISHKQAINKFAAKSGRPNAHVNIAFFDGAGARCKVRA
jgi:hypothetical protein